MSDEISQVVSMEINGMRYAVRGTVELAKLFARFIKFLYSIQKEKALLKPGEIGSYEDMLERSDGTPACFNVPKEMLISPGKDAKGNDLPSPFEKFCLDNGLRYLRLPDLDSTDDYIPFMVPSQESPMFAKYVESALNSRDSSIKAENEGFESRIREVDEKLQNKDLPDAERTELTRRKAMFEQAKDENLLETDKLKDMIANQGRISWEEMSKAWRTSPLANKEEQKRFMKVFNQVPSDSKEAIPAAQDQLKNIFIPIRTGFKDENGKFVQPDPMFFMVKGKDADGKECNWQLRRDIKMDVATGLLYSEWAIKDVDKKESFRVLFDDRSHPDMDEAFFQKEVYGKFGVDGESLTVFSQTPDTLEYYLCVVTNKVKEAKNVDRESGFSRNGNLLIYTLENKSIVNFSFFKTTGANNYFCIDCEKDLWITGGIDDLELCAGSFVFHEDRTYHLVQHPGEDNEKVLDEVSAEDLGQTIKDGVENLKKQGVLPVGRGEGGEGPQHDGPEHGGLDQRGR